MHLHQHYRRTCRKKTCFRATWMGSSASSSSHTQLPTTKPIHSHHPFNDDDDGRGKFVDVLGCWRERERGIERPTARVDNLHKKSPVAQKQHKYTFTHAAAPRLLYSLFSFFLSVFKRYVCISVSSSLQQHQKKKGRRSMMHRRQKQTIKDLHTNERTTKER